MTERSDDERVRQAFDDLQCDDDRASSTYVGVLAHARPQRATLHMSPVLRLAAAALMVAAIGTTLRIVTREPKLAVPREVIALTAWRPETDVLLAAPSQLLRAQTPLRESMIELDTLTRGVFR